MSTNNWQAQQQEYASLKIEVKVWFYAYWITVIAFAIYTLL